jgi:hypothetical protein
VRRSDFAIAKLGGSRGPLTMFAIKAASVRICDYAPNSCSKSPRCGDCPSSRLPRPVRASCCQPPMSAQGQSRPNWAVRIMSGLPQIATELPTSLVVRFVPPLTDMPSLLCIRRAGRHTCCDNNTSRNGGSYVKKPQHRIFCRSVPRSGRDLDLRSCSK